MMPSLLPTFFMVTALSERKERLMGIQCGANDFLTKPVDDFSLMARLNALSRYNAVTSELRQREAIGVLKKVIDQYPESAVAVLQDHGVDAAAPPEPATVVIFPSAIARMSQR